MLSNPNVAFNKSRHLLCGRTKPASCKRVHNLILFYVTQHTIERFLLISIFGGCLEIFFRSYSLMCRMDSTVEREQKQNTIRVQQTSSILFFCRTMNWVNQLQKNGRGRWQLTELGPLMRSSWRWWGPRCRRFPRCAGCASRRSRETWSSSSSGRRPPENRRRIISSDRSYNRRRVPQGLSKFSCKFVHHKKKLFQVELKTNENWKRSSRP
jgi:hypothetical protein